MGLEFTFYDYVDDGGVNLIHDWLHGPGSAGRARLNLWISHLEGMPPGQWSRPLWDALRDECAGLYEIRAQVSGVQFRLIACFGPGDREVTLLVGGTEKGNKFVPRNLCDQAQQRKARVFANPERQRREHDVR